MCKLKLYIIGLILSLTSCATSMSPLKVSNTLPTLTKSKSLSKAEAEHAIKSTKCKYLTRGRSYVAPIGWSLKDDLKKGARGIDEWVTLDGGNAYVLTSYKWITVDDLGSTQLYIEFDTMLWE